MAQERNPVRRGVRLLGAQPDQVAILHRRASMWYERNGLRSDAIRHALAAKDFEHAAGLIELAWPAAEKGDLQSALWIGWVKTLPDEMFHTRPVLNIDYAFALLGIGEIEAAETRIKDAERFLKPETGSPGMIVVDKEQYKSLPETIAIGRAYIAQAFGNIQETIKYTSQILELVPEADAFRCEQASMMLGMTYWATGDLEAAERVFADHTLRLRKAGDISVAISTTVVLADIGLALGHPQEAIHSIEELIQFILDQGEPIPLDAADLYRELSMLYLEQGNLEVASHHLQRSKELSEKAQLPVSRYRLYIDHARLRTAQGDLEGALVLLDEAEHLYVRSPLPDFCPISAMKARIWVAQGKLTKSQEWVREHCLSVDDVPNYLREFEHVTLARVLIARYKSDRDPDSIHEAIGLLDRLLHAAEDGRRMGSVIEILVLLALAHAAQGDIPPALVSLERALTLAKPEGYVRIFVDEGEVMRLLIEKQSRNQDHPQSGYADKLLAVFSQPVAAPKSAIIHQKPDMMEPLSERELEVLKLLRTDLNGPEIARECMVSLTTIRTHTQNIYTKLGVNNRRAAVRRAEELDLF